MTVTTRQTDLRREVVRADPDWIRTRNNIVEYRFSNGRAFKGNVPDRGIYGEGLTEEDLDNA
ncbi:MULTISPECIES: hypothetical protein [Hyphomicrobiales]|uniref:hypothetical protein n=1 Tax=Hyphomicrobiales TaxID=356 RepID=UPI003263DC5E